MGVVGDLSKYTQFQVAEAIRASASNQNGGGLIGAGIGLGAGMAVAQQVAQVSAGLGGGGIPPPLPGQAQYHVAINGQPNAMAAAVLEQQIRGGAITRDTLVWKQGMAAWVAAESVPELAALFGAVPPPLPK